MLEGFRRLCLFCSLILKVSTQPINLNFQQYEYKIEFEWGEAARFNKNIAKQFDISVFKYNRSCTALNSTFRYNVNIGNSMEIILQVYKFLSNEYRLFPAIRAQFSFCHSIQANLAGFGRILNCGNFTGCPLAKDRTYHYCNFVPDQTRLPPLIPSGKYKVELKALFQNEEVSVTNLYGRIYRPLDRK